MDFALLFLYSDFDDITLCTWTIQHSLHLIRSPLIRPSYHDTGTILYVYLAFISPLSCHRRRSSSCFSLPTVTKNQHGSRCVTLQALVTHTRSPLIHLLVTVSIFARQSSLIMGLPPSRHDPTLLTPSNCVPFDSLPLVLVWLSFFAGLWTLKEVFSVPSVLPTVVRYLVLC
jgi:hypothetical protein